jgi:hypothetical protein
MAARLMPAARDDLRLIRRHLQPKRAQPLTQRLGEPFRVHLLLKRAHEIVRVAHQARRAPTSGLDHLVNPQVQRIRQGHIGQEE